MNALISLKQVSWSQEDEVFLKENCMTTVIAISKAGKTVTNFEMLLFPVLTSFFSFFNQNIYYNKRHRFHKYCSMS